MSTYFKYVLCLHTLSMFYVYSPLKCFSKFFHTRNVCCIVRILFEPSLQTMYTSQHCVLYELFRETRVIVLISQVAVHVFIGSAYLVCKTYMCHRCYCCRR